MQRKLILINQARSPHEPLEALLDLRPQGIVIIDDHVPEAALRSLRLSEVSRELPVVLLLKDPTREMEVAAFAAGADELLAGDCHPSVLRARLAAVFRRAQALERLKSSLEEMDYFVRTV